MDDPGVANLTDLVRRNAQHRGSAEALVQPASPPSTERRALTWAQLDARVDALAAGYAGRGLRAGHRLGLSAPNSLNFVAAYLAALRAGLVAVPLDDALEPETRAALADELGVKLLLGIDDLSTSALDELARPDAHAVVSPPDAEALAVLLQSAGSSAHSGAGTDPAARWAMLSHRALLAQLLGPGSTVLDAEAVALGAAPLHHVFGLTTVLGGWLSAGAKLVVTEPVAERLLTVIVAEDVDHLPATPALLLRLLRSASAGQLGNLRWVLGAGAAVPDWLAVEFAERTGVRIERGYGLTEVAGGISATFGGPILGPSHVGHPLPGVEVRVGDGRDPEEPGLVAVRGGNLFSGYWPSGAGGPDADGWFATDDLGYLRAGELFLVDHSREVVVVQGFPVFPAEVEQVLREVPAVTGAAAVGVPDPRRGMRIVAYVSGDVTSVALEEHCRRLAPYKRPSEIHVSDDLPRDVKGEVHRTALRARLSDGRTP